MKLKLFKKYFLTSGIIILFSLSMMIMILLFVLNSYFAKSEFAQLSKSSQSIGTSVLLYTQGSIDSEELTHILQSVSDVSDTEVFLADSSGKVVLCGCGQIAENGEDLCAVIGKTVPEEYLDRIRGRDFVEIGTMGLYSQMRYIAASLVTEPGGKEIYVFSTAPVSSIQSLLSTVIRLYIFSALVPIVIMFAAIFVITYRMTSPLKQMSEATKAMARGDFSKRIPVTSDDEIGELAASFNQMTNSLVQLENMRRSFVANVSHELRTPMTSIGGFIDGIIDGTIDPEKQPYYLEIVSGEIKRLSRLVESMLGMAKLESGEYVLKPELFDFRELILKIVVSQEQRIEGKSIEIIGLDGLTPLSVKADRDLIHQVVYNLVDNAVKFTDPGGWIRFELTAQNRKLVFRIINSGKGIPEKELPFVFERFYKVDRSRSANKNSTGLGLYIAKTIISAHGGTIQAESKENEFTSFTVTLPV